MVSGPRFRRKTATLYPGKNLYPEYPEGPLRRNSDPVLRITGARKIDSGINPTDDYDNTNHSRPQVVLFSFSTFFQPFSKSFSGPFLTLLLLFQLPFLFPVPLCGLPGALLLLILQTGPGPWPDPLHRQPRTTCSRGPPQCGRHIRAGRADFPTPSHSNSALPCSLHTT